MSYEKQNFVDGQTLTAAQLNHMEDGIAAAATGVKGDPGEGFTANAKALLLNLFEINSSRIVIYFYGNFVDTWQRM